jgi:beta-galactosidase/beta-glucuronidase
MRRALLFIVMLGLAWLPTLAVSGDVVSGVWKLNVSKSKAGRSSPRSQTITVEPTATGHKWSYDTELYNGKKVHFWLTTEFPGGKVTLYSAEGKVMGTGRVTRQSDRSWDFEAPNHKSHSTISDDGKTMAVQTTVPTPSIVVLDKIK